ncbi:phage head spike fiber domain-containing protein [Comamonas thiooxydans]|uniref:phage head spike fiber domain-containing protein n=1 Tax=Comamonas thiooxydans TaxID=363952 RepID=UPI003D1602B5
MRVEAARTNRLLRSTDMSSSPNWTGSSGHECTLAPADAPLPWRVATSGLVSSSGWIQSLDIPAGVVTASVECARGDRDKARFGVTFGADFSWVQIDFVTGTVSIGANATLVPILSIGARPTSVGYRVWMTFTSPGGAAAFRVYAGSEVGVSVGYTYYGYPQVEDGSYPTSFIPTTTTAATRAAEAISLTPQALQLGAEFTVLQEIRPSRNLPSSGQQTLGISLYSSDTNRMRVMRSQSGAIFLSHRLSEAATMDLVFPSPSTAEEIAVAMSVSRSGLAACLGGGAVVSRARSGAAFGATPEMTFGSYRLTSPLDPFDGHLRRVVLYNRALTDAQLRRLTA